MKLIKANPNPFFTVLEIIDVCRERAVFHEDEAPLISQTYNTIKFLGEMLEDDSIACESDCDCELALESCNGSCQPEGDALPYRDEEQTEIQLELPLDQV